MNHQYRFDQLCRRLQGRRVEYMMRLAIRARLSLQQLES